MYDITGKIQSVTFSYESGKPLVTFEVNEKGTALTMADALRSADKLSLKVGKFREKRSLDANAYLWVLCGKLAEKLSEESKHTKEDVYRKLIKESGIYFDDEVEPSNVRRRCVAWGLIGEGWLTERVDFTQDGSKEIIRFYYGSSQYNTKQMSRLINNLVQDCEAAGIETKTPSEIADMLSLWEREK